MLICIQDTWIQTVRVMCNLVFCFHSIRFVWCVSRAHSPLLSTCKCVIYPCRHQLVIPQFQKELKCHDADIRHVHTCTYNATANHFSQWCEKNICLVVLSLSPTLLTAQPPTSISLSAHASTHTQKGDKDIALDIISIYKQKRSASKNRKSFLFPCDRRENKKRETGSGYVSVRGRIWIHSWR